MILCPLCNTGFEHRHSRGSMACDCEAFHCRAEGSYYYLEAGQRRICFYPGLNNALSVEIRDGNRTGALPLHFVIAPGDLEDALRELVAALVVDS